MRRLASPLVSLAHGPAHGREDAHDAVGLRVVSKAEGAVSELVGGQAVKVGGGDVQVDSAAQRGAEPAPAGLGLPTDGAREGLAVRLVVPRNPRLGQPRPRVKPSGALFYLGPLLGRKAVVAVPIGVPGGAADEGKESEEGEAHASKVTSPPAPIKSSEEGTT